MSDPIDRQAAITTAVKAAIDWHRLANPQYSIAYCIGEAMRELPSVQPEIVRCKDCKHQVKEWREDKRFKDNGYWVYGCEVISDVCGYWALFGQDDEFCSEAERRTDE